MVKRKLIKGQVVRLKSGGFPYTVRRIKADNRIVLSAPLVNDINVDINEIAERENK